MKRSRSIIQVISIVGIALVIIALAGLSSSILSRGPREPSHRRTVYLLRPVAPGRYLLQGMGDSIFLEMPRIIHDGDSAVVTFYKNQYEITR